MAALPVNVRFTSRLSVMADLVQQQSSIIAFEYATKIAELARELVARDTGSLEETIQVEPSETFPGGWTVVAGDESGGYKGGSSQNRKLAGDPVDYAADQEFGSARIVAQPYMTPAAEQLWPAYQEAMAAMLRSL